MKKPPDDGKRTAISVVRWIGVLPAAVLGSYAGRAIYGLVVQFYFQRIGYEGAGRWVRHLMVCLLSGTGYVVAGSLLAPRSRLATGVVLSIGAVAIAGLIHREDYLPIVAEAVGVAVGMAVTVAILRNFERRRSK